MQHKIRKQTKATRVLELIREDITTGKFLPGEKLQMDDLKQRYGVGYSPLREALSRLVSIGMVKLIEQCGFYVSPLSLDELHDLYRVRAHIEALALELAIQNGDDAWEADVVASWHVFHKYLDTKASNDLRQEEWEVLQNDFLHALVKGCKSPWLLQIRKMLYEQASRYRGMCIIRHSRNKKLLQEYIRENQSLVDAVLSRDVKTAIRISGESWQNSVNVIAEILQQRQLLPEKS